MITLPEFAVQGFMALLFGIAFYAFRRELQSIQKELADIKSDYRNEIQNIKSEYNKDIQELHVSLKERAAVAQGRITDRDTQHKEDLCSMRNQHKEDMKELLTLMTPKQFCEGAQKLWQERFENLMEQNKREHDYIIERIVQWDARMDEITGCLKKMAREEAC
jgi:arginine utilization protein RocB